MASNTNTENSKGVCPICGNPIAGSLQGGRKYHEGECTTKAGAIRVKDHRNDLDDTIRTAQYRWLKFPQVYGFLFEDSASHQNEASDQPQPDDPDKRQTLKILASAPIILASLALRLDDWRGLHPDERHERALDDMLTLRQELVSGNEDLARRGFLELRSRLVKIGTRGTREIARFIDLCDEGILDAGMPGDPKQAHPIIRRQAIAFLLDRKRKGDHAGCARGLLRLMNIDRAQEGN